MLWTMPSSSHHIAKHLLFIPFYLLPIEVANVVLGMDWLKTLGPLMVDFSIPKISFNYINKVIIITCDSKTSPTPSAYNKMCHLFHIDSFVLMHLLLHHPTQDIHQNTISKPKQTLDSLPVSLPKETTNIISLYSSIF